MYKCECGREFDKPNAFNGHKSHCKVHMEACGKLEEFRKVELNRKVNSIKTNNLRRKFERDFAAEDNLRKLTQWISEQHVCERCGKVMTGKYCSGRFCSTECAHSRIFSDEAKRKKAEKARDKKAYTDLEGTVHYIKVGDPIPEGYVEGNFANFTHGTLEQFLKSETIPKKRLFPKLEESEESKVSKEKRLRNYCKEIIHKHNQEVIKEYEDFLRDKARDKTFTINREIFMFAKYPTVTMDHPRGHEGHVFVHILLAECLLERPLNPYEIVHHKDEDKENNTFDNIWIFDSKGSHTRFHNNPECWLEIKGDVLIAKNLTLNELIELSEHQ